MQHLSSTPNQMSSHNYTEIIHQHLERKIKLGRMYKSPHDSKPLCVHNNPIRIIPKQNKLNKQHLIVDLSSPKSSSINNGIATELSSLCCTSVDHLSSIIISVGKGTLIVKADTKEANRMVPVNPDDQLLLAVEWANRIYIDRALPLTLDPLPNFFLQQQMLSNGFSSVMGFPISFIIWMILSLWPTTMWRQRPTSTSLFIVWLIWEYHWSYLNWKAPPHASHFQAFN